VTKRQLTINLAIGLSAIPISAIVYLVGGYTRFEHFWVVAGFYWWLFIVGPVFVTHQAVFGGSRVLIFPPFRLFYVADLWEPGEGLKTRVPRILITGFGPFPGAPVNPTETLIEALRADPSLLEGNGDIRTEILAVEYDTVPGRLTAFGAEFAPDIAIHFGLSAQAEGFTLERLARNEIARDRPDNAGGQPGEACIVEGARAQPSTLPLEAIASALDRAGLPHSWSDDAGGYLCNYIFYLSRSPHFADFSPEISGFIHVPPLAGPDAPENAIAIGDLVVGAKIIVRTCAGEWKKARAAA
jgi:pyroglutamyl-peptidase